MQFSVEHRFSQGLALLFTYFVTAQAQDNNCIPCERSVSQRFSVSDITGKISLRAKAHRVDSKLHEELFPVRGALPSVAALLL
jgi:hypothetical protein